MKIPLPVINAAFEVRGVAVRVTAAPWGLVKKLVSSPDPETQATATTEIVRTCCTIDGVSVDPDELTADDIATLSKLAISSKGPDSDFTKPPAGNATDARA
jgi:hypothetical protein